VSCQPDDRAPCASSLPFKARQAAVEAKVKARSTSASIRPLFSRVHVLDTPELTCLGKFLVFVGFSLSTRQLVGLVLQATSKTLCPSKTFAAASSIRVVDRRSKKTRTSGLKPLLAHRREGKVLHLRLHPRRRLIDRCRLRQRSCSSLLRPSLFSYSAYGIRTPPLAELSHPGHR